MRDHVKDNTGTALEEPNLLVNALLTFAGAIFSAATTLGAS